MKFTWSHNCAKSVQNLLGVKILTQNTPFCNFETVSEVASKYFCQLFEFTDARRLWRHILSILSQDEEQITCANFLSALRGENILIRFNQESFVSEINFLFVTPLPAPILMMKEIKFYCINQQKSPAANCPTVLLRQNFGINRAHME